MNKKIINEDIENIKYLFNYKPGRVISEQDIDYTTDEYLDMSEQEEPETDRYMFFSNLEQIHRQTGILLEKDPQMISGILENGHDWAQDHIATSKESIDQVFDFLMNEEKGDGDEITESKEIKEYFGGSEGVVNVDISGEGYLKSLVSKEIIKLLHNVGGDINLTINGDSVIRSGNRRRNYGMT